MVLIILGTRPVRSVLFSLMMPTTAATHLLLPRVWPQAEGESESGIGFRKVVRIAPLRESAYIPFYF